jgi:hypothetical protein
MCTIIIARYPDTAWPLILGANRDEMQTRPWLPPARHWPDRPEVVAGMDELSGGSWMGLNDHGLVAAVLNRRGTLGPAKGKRSRGELVLEALDHAEADAAADALSALNPLAYRGFNLVVADAVSAYWLRHADDGAGRIDVVPVPEGVSMLTAYDLNDMESGRVKRYLPQFRAAALPDPGRDDWGPWLGLLSDRSGLPGDGATGQSGEEAMNIVRSDGFGTVCSSLLALPDAAAAYETPPRRPIWRFAAGRPDEVPFSALDLEPKDGGHLR